MPASTIIRRLRFQEAGLVLVILVLGALLAFFGGSVTVPKMQTNAQGERERVFRTNAAGERELVTVERNKFLNVQSLASLAKDTSFIAVMAVGATFVIISGGIDLSVGAIYALVSVLGALVLHYYGPDGSAAARSPWFGISLGILTCVGVSLICGFLNGGMTVALKVHPFIITLGTMSIYRGIAFVITKGQSVGIFPQMFRDLVGWEIGDGLRLVPCYVMVIAAVLAGIYLRRQAA